MQGQIGRLWRRVRGRAATGKSARRAGRPAADVNVRTRMDLTVQDGLALPDPTASHALPPEQPVLLMPSGGSRPVHVGELLPARRQPWPLTLVRLPAIPKRAILAAGVFAGLAAPSLARHLATRMVMGRSATRVEGVLEITRIVYTGPLTPRAATAIGKVLQAGRR